MLTIGSLFSGIGGLELGLEWAGLGPVLWQVEIDPFCRSKLERHWPDVERFEDVTKIETLPYVDLICGGFPCQDISSAGKGAGLAGSRSGLWFEFAGIVSELRPTWVVVENVTSGASRWVDAVVAGLEQLDYETLPIPLSAGDVGAPHPRRRVFVIAYSECVELRQQSRWGGRTYWASEGVAGVAGTKGKTADSEQGRRRGRAWSGEELPGWAQPEDGGRWPPVSPVCGVDARFPDRVDRLRALGNAVVPQCAEVIGWVIRELKEVQR